MGCLYEIVAPNGKRYIGITSRKLSERWKVHRAEAKRSVEGHLQNAIRKYGVQSMRCLPLVYADDYEYLKELERKAIQVFGTKSPNGYNMTDGGDGVLGVIITEEGRKRRRAAQQASFADPARRERHRQTQRDPVLRARRSETQKRKMADPVFKARVHEKARLARQTPEYAEKLKARPAKPRIEDGLTNSQRTRLKNLDAYRKRKREWAKTPSQKEYRKAYAKRWRDKRKAANAKS